MGAETTLENFLRHIDPHETVETMLLGFTKKALSAEVPEELKIPVYDFRHAIMRVFCRLDDLELRRKVRDQEKGDTFEAVKELIEISNQIVEEMNINVLALKKRGCPYAPESVMGNDKGSAIRERCISIKNEMTAAQEEFFDKCILHLAKIAGTFKESEIPAYSFLGDSRAQKSTRNLLRNRNENAILSGIVFAINMTLISVITSVSIFAITLVKPDIRDILKSIACGIKLVLPMLATAWAYQKLRKADIEELPMGDMVARITDKAGELLNAALKDGDSTASKALLFLVDSYTGVRQCDDPDMMEGLEYAFTQDAERVLRQLRSEES
ncbi:hypothetical protein HOG48_06615 [Candidatus Peregrinibacteria bacterium]|jgi:hypothetical protein|nr:hypothetical protein [Candidatus Peregrinibacteria bacterium]